jgi:uncharacterized protein YbjT (DUF2867 family)
MKKAILFGATGFVGAYLLEDLLHSDNYEKVTVVVRKELNISHPKLEVVIGDFRSLPLIKDKIVADDIFITIGTTKAKTPDKKEYYKIDHDYPVLAAAMAKEQGAKAVFIVTAVGANAASKIFYVRTKGKAEEDIIALDFEQTHIFRPSMIMGNRGEKRVLESIFLKIWRVIDPVLTGGLSKYRGIEGKDIAKAMLKATTTRNEKLKIYQWKDMKDLL